MFIKNVSTKIKEKQRFCTVISKQYFLSIFIHVEVSMWEDIAHGSGSDQIT